jgi:acetyltransferase
VRVERAAGGGHRRLALSPYPAELIRNLEIGGLGPVAMRPVRPEDAAALTEFFARLDAEDVRMRFFLPLHRLEPRLLARLTQIDYDREMAFVAWSESAILGIARIAADPDNARAEFAVTVRSDLKRRGLGNALLSTLIGYARDRGIGEIWGDVLSGNAAMLALADGLGFRRERSPAPDAVRVRLAPGRA